MNGPLVVVRFFEFNKPKSPTIWSPLWRAPLQAALYCDWLSRKSLANQITERKPKIQTLNGLTYL